jgi:opacity protein-like surface antigen
VDLLGKYPFALNEKFTVFPALGIGLKFPFAGNEQSDKEHDITWGVTAKAGAGLDFAVTQALFLRCEALFAYQFASDQEAKIEQSGQTLDFKFKPLGYNLGPQIKIGVGYKIF